MIIGVAYYPEHWDRKRWETDCALMRDMGINTVRMGEFGWSVMEREEGKLDFFLYDEAIGLLWEYGISTILGTPTATPPAWLCEKYPDIYMEDRDGHVRGFGSRRHYCYRHKGYLQETARFVRAMAEHYKDDERVVAWQIDNELGCEDEVRCYCDDCRAAFIQWLKEKYQTLDVLNEAWGTVFWSQIYTKWEQIPLPKQTVVDLYTGTGHNPGLLLDFAEFSSDSLIEFAKVQCDILRSLTDRPIVHNVVSEYCDNYKLTALLDGAGYDAYPRSEWDLNSPGRIGFHYDLTRGYDDRKPFWILEQQSGPCGWNVLGRTPKRGQLSLWSIQGAARGAQALVYFRWRSCLFGAEQFWYGILDHDGLPGRRYEELQSAVAGIKKYEDIFKMKAQRQVLVLYDYYNKFSLEFQPHGRQFVYKEEVIGYYEAMMKLHLSIDVGGLETDFSPYQMIVFPFACMADEKITKKLEAYVRYGGILVLTALSGRKKRDNQMWSKTQPGVFRELAGVTVEEFDSLEEQKERIVWQEGQDRTPMTARLWCEILRMEGAEQLAFYEDLCETGKNGEEGGNGNRPVISVNRYGKGSVYYIGAVLEDTEKALEKVCIREGLERPDLPTEIECVTKENGKYRILLNHGSEKKWIQMEGYKLLGEISGKCKVKAVSVDCESEKTEENSEIGKRGIVLEAFASAVFVQA